MYINSTMVSAMNCMELLQVQSMIQAELNTKKQKVADFKKNAAELLKNIYELTGTFDDVQDVISNVLPSTQSEQVEEIGNEQEPTISECEVEHPEQPVTEEEQKEVPEELLPSISSLLGEDKVEDEMDPFEYRNEEEYNLIKKRSKMLPTIESLLTGYPFPAISQLGLNKPSETSFCQNERIIDAMAYGGKTLTAQSAPLVHIP